METFFLIYFLGFAEWYFLSVFQLMINFCGRIFQLNLKGFLQVFEAQAFILFGMCGSS